MGGRRKEPDTIIMNPATQTEKFQTVIPASDFQKLAESQKAIMGQSAQLDKNRFDSGYSPSEMGVRDAGVRVQEAASYLSSLPQSSVNTQFQATPRPFDIKSTDSSFSVEPGQVTSKTGASIQPPTSQLTEVKKAAKDRLDVAKAQYAAALTAAATAKDPVLNPTLGSFKDVDPKDYMPRRYNPETGKMDIV